MTQRGYALPVEGSGSGLDDRGGTALIRITVQKYDSATLELHASHTTTIPASAFDAQQGGLRAAFWAAVQLFRNRVTSGEEQ